jgi:DNA/RNA endonuclease G (NUC1)
MIHRHDHTLYRLSLLILAALLLLSPRELQAQPGSRHLALGNPSGASADPGQPANYLIDRAQYALSYHRDRGIPNWVSWNLRASDLGPVGRCDQGSSGFQPDTSLPGGWYQVRPSDYTNSGYDRGHMTPSADRTATQADNCATFLMTNVVPQAPANNQGLWAQLEDYSRGLVNQGNELYIISGGAGTQGTLASGALTIPASVWKVILVLPAANGDAAARVSAQSQVIAIWTPNSAETQGRSWQSYQTTVACIQQRTGLNFFAAVADPVEAAIEGAGCDGSTPPPPPPPPPAADQRCFPETGQCIAGPLRRYWERNGGLAVFGYPITPQGVEVVEGRTLQVQWFERDRLEIQADGLVTAGRLGVERLEQLGTPWVQGTITGSAPPCIDFPQTGYQICNPAFAAYWRNNGGLERFGYPVTGEFDTVLEGRSYRVQYFERRRFELHPQIGPNVVLLGLLGREVLNGRGAPPSAPPLPAPSYNGCADDPSAGQAPNFPVAIVAIDKAAETVTLRNQSGQPINLDGWIMCSVRGSQQHPVGGQLGPGETRVFPGPDGNIWSNGSSDPGALYNPEGRLVSYWPD